MRLQVIIELAYERLRNRVNSGRIKVDNEAGLQLQLGALLKVVGELYETGPDERFLIELEKRVRVGEGRFGKSGSDTAKVDIYCAYARGAEIFESCAIELKFFQRKNHREPNNRYDVFCDLANLEQYGGFADIGYLIVATDHDHYVRHAEYSPATSDFDFRDGVLRSGGTTANYKTDKPYGAPITLSGDYKFDWDVLDAGTHFLKVPVYPAK